MFQYTRYYGQFQDLRGNFGGLPPWARTIVSIVAIPGIILILLSILAFVVSVSALLLLTVPVYSLLRNLTGGGSAVTQEQPDEGSAGVKRVEATVVNDRPV
jgi:hypothetical protein